MSDAIRSEYVRAALVSVRDLLQMMPKLTEQELHEVLRVEHESRRRRSLMDRVITRLATIKAEETKAHLQEQFYGTEHKRSG